MSKHPTEFEQARASADANLVTEFLRFLAHNKKWWLLPIFALLLLLGGILLLGSSAAAPFIYSLF